MGAGPIRRSPPAFMIPQKIEQIETKIEQATDLPSETRNDLLHLLADLRVQVELLSKTNQESAQSVTTLAHASAHQATRTEKDPEELHSSLEKLTDSVVGLETSHPKLAEVVNRIALILANMGI
jgi:Domain of unknown function (DUF4404)